MNTAEIEQRTDDWYSARAGHVTASCISKVMSKGRGNAPSATRATYMGELLAERESGVAREGFKSAAMDHGIETEAEAIGAYELAKGVTVETVGFVKHPEIAMTGASPDGLIGDLGLIEVKCPNTATHVATLQGADIARPYMLQMQWQMACTGRQWVDFVSYDPRIRPALQLHTERVHRNQAMIDEIEGAVIAFNAELDGVVNALNELENKVMEVA